MLWCLSVSSRLRPRAGLHRVFQGRQRSDIFPTFTPHQSSPETWPWHCGHLPLLLSTPPIGVANLLHYGVHFPSRLLFQNWAHYCCFYFISSLHRGLGNFKANTCGLPACSLFKSGYVTQQDPHPSDFLATTTLSGFSFQFVLCPHLRMNLENIFRVCWIT